VVSNWYAETQAKYFRQNEMQGVADRLSKGDTITLGIDYYGLFSISKVWLDWLDPKIFNEVGQEIYDGKVVVIKVWFDKRIKYKRI